MGVQVWLKMCNDSSNRNRVFDLVSSCNIEADLCNDTMTTVSNHNVQDWEPPQAEDDRGSGVSLKLPRGYNDRHEPGPSLDARGPR